MFEISKRDDLVKLIDQHSLKVGAEIGVAEGDFSNHLLTNSKLTTLYSIDAWSTDEVATHSVLKRCDRNQDKFDGNYKVASEKLAKHGQRSVVIRDLSENAGVKFADKSLDFIYLDGAHTFTGLCRDLMIYDDKLREGGIMACHDYWLNRYRAQVLSTVNAFLTDRQYLPSITIGERAHPMFPPTVYWFKTALSKGDYLDALKKRIPILLQAKEIMAKKGVRIELPPEYIDFHNQTGCK